MPLCLSLCSKAKLQWNNGRDEAELHDIRTKGSPQKQHSLVDLKEQGVYDMVVEHKIVASGEHTYVHVMSNVNGMKAPQCCLAGLGGMCVCVCVLSVCLSVSEVYCPACLSHSKLPSTRLSAHLSVCLFISLFCLSHTQFIHGTILINEKLGCACMLLSSTANLSGSHIERRTNSKWRTRSPTSHMSEKSGCVSNLFFIPNCSRRDLVLSHLVLSYLILSCLALRCVVLSCLVLSCLVLYCVFLSCPLFCLSLIFCCLLSSCVVLFCFVLSFVVFSRVLSSYLIFFSLLFLSCLVLCLVLFLVVSCLVLSFLVLSSHVLSCHVFSCLTMSCHVMSCLVLSCPVFVFVLVFVLSVSHFLYCTPSTFFCKFVSPSYVVEASFCSFNP
jgi:hypothetical protein